MLAEAKTRIDSSSVATIHLKRRILLPLLLVLVIITATIVSSISQLEYRFIADDIVRTERNVQEVYALSNDKRAEEMTTELRNILDNRQLFAAFLAKDRRALLDIGRPIFKRLQSNYDISHFYLFNKDRTVLMRYHIPNQFGDVIDRHTLLTAESTGQRSFGTELGPFGTFTLRVVEPWYDEEGTVQGYVELGVQLENLMSDIKFMFDVDPYLFVSKEFIMRKRWEDSMARLGRSESWDQLPTSVTMAGPKGPLLDSLVNIMQAHPFTSRFTNQEFASENKTYRTSEIIIKDAADRPVGKLIILIDITNRINGLNNTMLRMGGIGLVLNGLMLIFFYIILNNTENLFTRYHNQIVEEGRNRENLQQEHIKELEHLALYDPLTDLPNRLLLQDRIDHAMQVSQREKHTLALTVFNLNRLREINNTLGHQAGDLVLREVAIRLQQAVRGSDTIARLGGDEFAVLMPMVDTTFSQHAVEKIQSSLELSFDIEGIPVAISSCFGIAFYPSDATDVDHLIQHADVAMRDARRSHRGIVVYNAERDPYNLRSLKLFSELKSAFSNKELFLEYQPKIAMDSRRIIEAEALVRWQHPTEGVVSPHEFVPLLEKTTLINDLTRNVLDQALHQVTEWIKQDIDIKIAVNVSMFDLYTTDLSELIRELLQQYELAPDRLVLEITESVIMEDPETIILTLNKLSTMGIAMSIDDFGTGYSSLAYLQQLPVTELKIDQSFIRNMVTNSSDEVIVSSIIQLAHNLGLTVVAEGVDNKTTWEKLHELKCDIVQGFYISKPIPAKEFSPWLDNPDWKKQIA